MKKHRTERINSLLREVLSEVIRKDVKNPHIHALLTITRVEITKDLHYAKVYFTVMGTEKQKSDTLHALTSAAGFIGQLASKKVSLRFFPHLTFHIDEGLEQQLNIERLIDEISDERKNRLEE